MLNLDMNQLNRGSKNNSRINNLNNRGEHLKHDSKDIHFITLTQYIEGSKRHL